MAATLASRRPEPASLHALGVELDAELLRRALTHRSYAYEHGGLPHNERLEFLGDSVLGIVVTETLYRAHPDLPEGRLAKLRASVVNMRALADVARGIGPDGLGAYLLPRPRRGGHRRTGQVEHPGRRPRGPARRDLPRARAADVAPGSSTSCSTTLMTDVADSGAGAGLEDEPAGAHRRARPRRARVHDDLDRARITRRPFTAAATVAGETLRAEHRAQQEGGRAGRGRDRLARADAAAELTHAGERSRRRARVRRGPARLSGA